MSCGGCRKKLEDILKNDKTITQQPQQPQQPQQSQQQVNKPDVRLSSITINKVNDLLSVLQKDPTNDIIRKQIQNIIYMDRIKSL